MPQAGLSPRGPGSPMGGLQQKGSKGQAGLKGGASGHRKMPVPGMSPRGMSPHAKGGMQGGGKGVPYGYPPGLSPRGVPPGKGMGGQRPIGAPSPVGPSGYMAPGMSLPGQGVGSSLARMQAEAAEAEKRRREREIREQREQRSSGHGISTAPLPRRHRPPVDDSWWKLPPPRKLDWEVTNLGAKIRLRWRPKVNNAVVDSLISSEVTLPPPRKVPSLAAEYKLPLPAQVARVIEKMKNDFFVVHLCPPGTELPEGKLEMDALPQHGKEFGPSANAGRRRKAATKKKGSKSGKSKKKGLLPGRDMYGLPASPDGKKVIKPPEVQQDVKEIPIQPEGRSPRRFVVRCGATEAGTSEPGRECGDQAKPRGEEGRSGPCARG